MCIYKANYYNPIYLKAVQYTLYTIAYYIELKYRLFYSIYQINTRKIKSNLNWAEEKVNGPENYIFVTKV